MRSVKTRLLWTGIGFLVLFAVWTVLVRTVDVRFVEATGTEVGFAALNFWFHQLTGVHMLLYMITDWLGFVPIGICILFGVLGLVQLVQRKRLLNVDLDLLLLGFYYLLVIIGYMIFEMIPIHYRPIRIEGRLEASYPSSTTLLVLSVMPTLSLQVNRRVSNSRVRQIVRTYSVGFSVLMVAGRLCSGVHWLVDIIGSILLSTGLYEIYHALVVICCGEDG